MVMADSLKPGRRILINGGGLYSIPLALMVIRGVASYTGTTGQKT